MKQTFKGNGVPPPLDGTSNTICEDPACFRERPHWVREWGCRWSNNAIVNKDGTVTHFKDRWGRPLPEPVTK